MRFIFVKSTLHVLRYGAFAKLWPYLSYAMIRLLGVRFSAYLTARTIDWGDASQGPVVLCLFRESFIKDVYEMRKRTNMRFAVVMGGFTRFQEVWFPAEMQTQTFYQTYKGSGRDRALYLSRLYAHYLLIYAERRSTVQAVLSANFDYWQDVGLKQVCKERKIPFVVLSREHPVIPKVCDVVTKWYVESAYAYKGDIIAVAGNSTKNVLARIGTVCRDDQVIITGLPRFDAWRDVDCSLPCNERKCITLLTFTKGYYADQGFEETLSVFLQAAKNLKGTGLRFLIKTKDAHDQNLILQMIPKELSKFVDCDYEENLFEILPLSRSVVGYNSLSLVEAVMAGCHLIIPAWGEFLDRGPRVMYSIEDTVVSERVDYAYSPNQLLEMLIHPSFRCKDKNSSELTKKFIEKYIYRPTNTTSSQLVVECIENSIRQNDSGRSNPI